MSGAVIGQSSPLISPTQSPSGALAEHTVSLVKQDKIKTHPVVQAELLVQQYLVIAILHGSPLVHDMEL